MQYFKERQLSVATSDGDLRKVIQLLKTGLDPNWPLNDESFDYFELDDDDESPWEPPLFLASWLGHEKIAHHLLRSSANPNDAIYSPRLARAANLRTYTSKWTPLLASAAKGHRQLIHLLLSNGAEVNWRTTASGETAFSLALKEQEYEIAHELLLKGFDISLFDTNDKIDWFCEAIGEHEELSAALRDQLLQGNIADEVIRKLEFVYAVKSGDTSALRRGIQQGMDVDEICPGNMKATPLYFVAWMGDVSTMEWLIDHGANVNYEAEAGTVLMRAAIHGHLGAVKLLIEKGADPMACIEGTTVLDLVDRKTFPDVFDYLCGKMGRGARP